MIWDQFLRVQLTSMVCAWHLTLKYYCMNSWYTIKWSAYSPWSFRPNFAWGSIGTTTIRKTHPTLLCQDSLLRDILYFLIQTWSGHVSPLKHLMRILKQLKSKEFSDQLMKNSKMSSKCKFNLHMSHMTMSYLCKCLKIECVLPMVIWPKFRMEQYRDDG